MAGDHRAAYKNKVASTANRGGLLSGWVFKPNHVPELQSYFQKNAGAVNVHHLGKMDGTVNKAVFGFTLMGLGSVLFLLGSMSLGVNKKKKAE